MKRIMITGTNEGLRLGLGDALEDVRGGGPRALSARLGEALRSAVRDGRLPAGTRLPASRALAEDMLVSRDVVVRAYEQLVAEGYLRAHTGRGTVVGDVRAADDGAPPSVDRALPVAPGLPALGSFPRRAWLRARRPPCRSCRTPSSATRKAFGSPPRR